MVLGTRIIRYTPACCRQGCVTIDERLPEFSLIKCGFLMDRNKAAVGNSRLVSIRRLFHTAA